MPTSLVQSLSLRRSESRSSRLHEKWWCAEKGFLVRSGVFSLMKARNPYKMPTEESYKQQRAKDSMEAPVLPEGTGSFLRVFQKYVIRQRRQLSVQKDEAWSGENLLKREDRELFPGGL